MSFKAESDDARDSLSFKLRKLLTLECRKVLCSDPYVPDRNLVPQEQVLKEADIIFIGAPHKRYASLHIPSQKLIDVWNIVPSEEAS
jgi:UDP-N-acetyl-D-mannosaminuronic acid dehydrogenase